MGQSKMIFNIEALRELIEIEETGETGLIETLISDYVSNSATLFEKIDAFKVNQDSKSAERAAHSLKSSSALLGLELVSETALKIETDSRVLESISESDVQGLKLHLQNGTDALHQFNLSRKR